jgi:exodeoxyribonuclease V gamma subunit
MPLQIFHVERLADVVGHAAAFLDRDDDVFARPRIVVPTAGAKAWLHDRLARRLGTSGPGSDDGIVANVEILFSGALADVLQPAANARDPDPWALDSLTFAVLAVITEPAAAALGIPGDVTREPLLTARRIAGLFDEYHVRRPGMILEWERAEENPVLAPTANDEQRDGEPVPAALREGDLWQFRLWRAVRRRINAPSPPARRSLAHHTSRDRILVAGVQSLSLPQLECLEELGTVCDVEALLVHPSPGLRAIWTASGQQPLRADLRGRPLQKVRDPEFPDGVDPLLPVWLSGARDLQELLAARGAVVQHLPAAPAADRPDSLLVRMQRTVSAGGVAVSTTHDPATDRSLLIHRCHSLSRQAEVLHDALLEAFDEIEDLEPHEVAIVSPCIEKAAPHLEAVFQRTVFGLDRAGGRCEITLPLVVADRGIREASPAADLLGALLAVPGSRASIDDVLAVAGHALVRDAFGTDDDTLAAWADLVERTAVRWGLDAAHRSRHGLTLPDHPDVHTWNLGLERMLLGVLLPDATPRPELGGVVPLDDLDPVDLPRVTTLVRILDVLRRLATAAADPRPVADWCAVIEQALVALCGEECPDLAEPLAHLRRLRESATATAAETQPVPFEDVHHLLVDWLDEKSGRQPLRTGAITATSMVPLRGVPFRVIGVIGYDDGAVGGGEADGDDLVARQQLLGDVDPRPDERRALLDCVLSAGDRLVITCTGRNVKSNKRVPLVTPLAEFVDFAVRHGVVRDRIDAPSGIEVDHPRHHLSRRNFEPSGVRRSGPWSHDRIACEVLEAVEQERGGPRAAAALRPSSRGPAAASPPTAAGPILTELSLLERLVKDPLGLYLEETLGIDTWRADDEAIPATLPLELDRRQARILTRELLHVLVEDPTAAAAWVEAQQRSGMLPLGPHVRRQVDEIVALAAGLKAAAESRGLHLGALASEPLDDLPLGKHRLVGTLEGVHRTPNELVVVMTGKLDKDGYGRPVHMAALHLLAARAAGIEVDRATIISRRNDWEVGRQAPPTTKRTEPRPMEAGQARSVRLAGPLMIPAAAAARLDAIAALAHEAVAAARPAFGTVLTAAADKREAEFERAIDGGFYGRTSECALFGVSPSFADVFGAASERLAFLDAFKQRLDPAYQRQEGGFYLLS